MSTRHARAGAPLSDERFMSSPEYLELRGVSGIAVSARAAILQSAAKRKLLYFLQAQSLKEGGFKKVGADLVKMFPNRVRPITSYDHMDLDDAKSAPRVVKLSEAALQQRFEKFLVQLCINPGMEFQAPGDEPLTLEWEREDAKESLDVDPAVFREARLDCFDDVIGALFEYQRACSEAAAKSIAMTEVSKVILDTIKSALAIPKIYVIEGFPGCGKSRTAEALAAMHAGELRYIELLGACNQTSFFRLLAKALGVASSYMRTLREIRPRVEDVLQRTRLCLVIDESFHLISSGERVYAQPECLNWLYTACTKFRISIVLLTTSQFKMRVQQVDQQIIWNFGQLARRMRYIELPTKTPLKDLKAVAVRRIPKNEPESIDLAVGYAGAAPFPLTALDDAITLAEQFAKEAKRATISFEDMDRAVAELTGSDAARARAFPPEEMEKRRRKPGKTKTGKHQAAARPMAIVPADEEVEPPSSRRNGNIQVNPVYA